MEVETRHQWDKSMVPLGYQEQTKPKEINATMRAFHTSQHVTGPQRPTRPDGSCQHGRGGVGEGETGTNKHSMLVCLPAWGGRGGCASYLRRLLGCQRARHRGKRLVCLLHGHGEFIGRGGGGGARLQGREGGKGRQGATTGAGRGGSDGRRRGWTDREMEEREGGSRR